VIASHNSTASNSSFCTITITMTGMDEAVGVAKDRGKELEENGFGIVLEKKGEALSSLILLRYRSLS
jgi:hypothetical protein